MTTRAGFQGSLDALRVDVDAIGQLVEEAASNAIAALVGGDELSAHAVIGGDDFIDALFLALEERTYALLAQQAPVARDLRLLMSALRVMADWEKAGDRAVAVAKEALAPWEREVETLTLLGRMGELAISLVRAGRQAWLEQDLALADDLKRRDDDVDSCYRRLVAHLVVHEGPNASLLVLHAHAAGRNLERIADHAVMVGERVSYLVTGEPSALAAEIK